MRLSYTAATERCLPLKWMKDSPLLQSAGSRARGQCLTLTWHLHRIPEGSSQTQPSKVDGGIHVLALHLNNWTWSCCLCIDDGQGIITWTVMFASFDGQFTKVSTFVTHRCIYILTCTKWQCYNAALDEKLCFCRWMLYISDGKQFIFTAVFFYIDTSSVWGEYCTFYSTTVIWQL